MFFISRELHIIHFLILFIIYYFSFFVIYFTKFSRIFWHIKDYDMLCFSFMKKDNNISLCNRPERLIIKLDSYIMNDNFFNIKYAGNTEQNHIVRCYFVTLLFNQKFNPKTHFSVFFFLFLEWIEMQFFDRSSASIKKSCANENDRNMQLYASN